MKRCWILPSLLGLALGACSSSPGDSTTGTGGTTLATTGGTTATATGGTTATATGGTTALASGGTSAAATGGATPAATGGKTSVTTGGTIAATGGTPATGGSKPANGGSTTIATGGTMSSGGVLASGGTTGQDAGTGGVTANGGSPATGGVPAAGGTSTKPDASPGTGGVASTGGSSGGTSSGMRNITSMELVKDMHLGWNLGNTLDSTSGGETGWGNPVTTQAMIDKVKEGGFKTVRIPVTWQSHLGGAPNYTIDTAWLDRVEVVANYVLKNGMYAIVNTHHDGWYKLATASQAQGVDEVTKVWTQIANRFKNYNDYLILETFNEPHGSVNAYGGGNAEQQTVLNAYNLAAVNAIRATGGNNALRHIMVPTHGASPPDAAINALIIPNDDPRIIVSVHTYYPGGLAFGGQTTWGTASDYTAMAKELDRIAGLTTKKGHPVVIGEWGTVDQNNLDVRVKHAKAYAQDVTARGMCPVWWDNGGRDFGILNRKVNPPTWTWPTIVSALADGANAGSTTAADATP